MEFAREIAVEAGELTRRYFRGDFEVERKSDDSPVTIADREAERLLRRRIEEAFPRDGIVGEEFGEADGSSGYRWVLDPIDGTKSFIHGVPLYGNLVGVEFAGRALVGVINIPVLGELVYAGQGCGAWYSIDGRPAVAARVANRPLGHGLFVTTQVDSFSRRGASAAFEQLAARARVTRTWGDCYGYLLVATGRADVMIDPEMNVWDACAIQPVLEEAGGVFCDWRGEPTIHHGEGVGVTPAARDEVLAITGPFAKPA